MSERAKKKKKQKPEKLKQKVSEFLALPKELTLDLSKITITGNRELFIENYKGIIEYEENRIRIKTKEGVVKLEGNNMSIKEITSDDIIIYGVIDSIQFLD